MNRGHFRIAILEDNLPDLLMIQHSIRNTGLDCEMTGFSDGAEALAFIKEPTSPVPDLLILDINVPGVEGPSILNAVRGNTRWSHIAVFVFTSSRAPADVARVKALGADRYLVKPMDLDGFLQFGQNISAWLEKREAPFGKEQEILD